MDADGSNNLALTEASTAVTLPAHWSHDGKRLAYAIVSMSATGGPGSGHLWVMNADGTEKTQLTFGALSPRNITTNISASA